VSRSDMPTGGFRRHREAQGRTAPVRDAFRHILTLSSVGLGLGL
jgi:hypothetical protein